MTATAKKTTAHQAIRLPPDVRLAGARFRDPDDVLVDATPVKTVQQRTCRYNGESQVSTSFFHGA